MIVTKHIKNGWTDRLQTANLNNFPRVGIKTEELRAEVERLLGDASQSKDNLGAVNWGDLGVVDIEYRMSMMDENATPRCVVLVEEASPESGLVRWLNTRLDRDRFPNTYIECEW